MSVLSSGTQSSAKSGHTRNTFGVVLQIETAEKIDGKLVITGIALNDIPEKGKNAKISVVFRDNLADRAEGNLLKANGKKSLETPTSAKGAMITLDHCYFDTKAEGDIPVVNSRWLNTLSSVRNNDGDRAFLEGIVAFSPRVMFRNPDFRTGELEPENITIPTNTSTIKVRVDTGHGKAEHVLTREAALEKLSRATAKPRVLLDTLQPAMAVKVACESSLNAALQTALSTGPNASAVIRLFDGEDVRVRRVTGRMKQEGEVYKADADAAIAELWSSNVLGGVNNDDFRSFLSHPEVTAEVIPGYRFNYAGDPTKDDNSAYSVVQSLKTGKTLGEQVIFGDNADNLASVLVPGLDRGPSPGGEYAGFSPIRAMGDRSGTYTLLNLPTAVQNPGKALEEKAANAPAP